MEVPDGPNQCWRLDFVSDAFTDGRRFRILTVIDDFTKENVLLVPDTSISGLRGSHGNWVRQLLNEGNLRQLFLTMEPSSPAWPF